MEIWGEEKKSAERAPSEGPRSMRAVNDNLTAPSLSLKGRGVDMESLQETNSSN